MSAGKHRKALFVTGIILIILAVLVVSVIAGRNHIVKYALCKITGKIIGAPVSIGSVAIDMARGNIMIEKFNLYNPRGFPNEALLDVPEISVDIDTSLLFKGKLHIPQLTVNLKELVAIRNKEGELNVDSLKIVKDYEKSQKEEGDAQKRETAPSGQPGDIDKLTLSIGQAIYKDYSRGGEPTVQTFDINIKNKTYEGIPDIHQVIMLVVTQVLMSTTIESAVKVGTAAMLIGGSAATGGLLLVAGLGFRILEEGHVQVEFSEDYQDVYNAAHSVASDVGKVSESDERRGIIKSSSEKEDFTIEIKKESRGKVHVVVLADTKDGPDPEKAKRVLSDISEKIKKDTL